MEIVRSASPPIDLALVDYSLQGMTGDRCLGELRRAQPGLKAILITGYDLNETDVVQADCRILYKPFAVPAMAQMVRDVLDGKEAPELI